MKPVVANGEFTRLIDYLKQSRGFDFSAYKISTLILEEHATLSDRLAQRMGKAGKDGLEDRYASRVRGSERYARILREILLEDEKELDGNGGLGSEAMSGGRAVLTARRAPRARNLE